MFLGLIARPAEYNPQDWGGVNWTDLSEKEMQEVVSHYRTKRLTKEGGNLAKGVMDFFNIGKKPTLDPATGITKPGLTMPDLQKIMMPLGLGIGAIFLLMMLRRR